MQINRKSDTNKTAVANIATGEAFIWKTRLYLRVRRPYEVVPANINVVNLETGNLIEITDPNEVVEKTKSVVTYNV